MKRLASVILALILCLGLALPAAAADNSAVDAKIVELQKKYDLVIQYDKDSDGSASIGTGTLHTLDTQLAKVTPEVVKQVSAFVQRQTGRKLTYSFTYSFNLPIDLPANVEAHGVFHEDRGVIEIFLPSSSRDTYSSGDNPLAMVHEFAHALEWFCRAQYGDKLQSEWTALNAGAAYSSSFDGTGGYKTNTFISLYAATSYDEDFAETFAHAIIRDRAGLGFYNLLSTDGVKTPLGKKVDYLIALLPRCLQSSATITANLQKAYTTSIYKDFQGQRLTGIHMQYMGLSYPRYVLKGIMSAPEVNDGIASSTWVYEIGGWYVVSTSGKYYLVYPGGVVRQQSGPLTV